MTMHWRWTPVLLLGLAQACQSADNGSDASDLGGSGGSDPSAAGNGGAAGAPVGSGAVSEPGVTYIQEDEVGFSAVDGKVLPREGSTSVTGYTGTGFADADSGVGTSISWGLRTEAGGEVELVFRYAFGGDEANLRDAELSINGEVVVPRVVFSYTTTWDAWQETEPIEVALEPGSNHVVLRALEPGGLANIDYLLVLGEGVTPDEPHFSLSVSQNDEDAGSVSYSPEAPFYAAGDAVALLAEPNPGYVFQSWTGDFTSAEAEATLRIRDNTEVVARFLPEAAEQDPRLLGYAGVQDDEGTPYLVTGGSLGEAVTAESLEELKGYLEDSEPRVVSFSGLIEGADSIEIASDKTLLGVGEGAHLMGIELQVNGSRNVVIQNVAVSHVVAEGAGTANDAIVITGGAENVWVDHCELFSDRDNGKDYYDGLLEIKNEASFVTVSYTEFHDHYKVSLISSGDEQVGDGVIRATFHHNFFHDCESRMPSIRFGKAHVFNNYYRDNTSGSGVNSRMGAVVRVEQNYFLRSKDPVGSRDSPVLGSWEVLDNVYDECSGDQPTESTGSLEVPYAVELDGAPEVPAIVEAEAGIGKL